MAENVQATWVATMNDEKVYRKTNARLFESGFFEAFSKVHPAIPAVIFVPALAYFVWNAFVASWMFALPLVALGVLFWSLTEYVLHRWYFHMDQSNAVKRFLYFYSHGMHHAYPDDYYRLVMVPIVSLPLAALFYGLYSAVFPAWMVPGIFAGMLVGYLNYDYVHFATHHVKPPRSKLLAPVAHIMKVQRERHMRHHFETHDVGYGVSTVLWDVVFGTTQQKKTKKEPSQASAAQH